MEGFIGIYGAIWALEWHSSGTRVGLEWDWRGTRVGLVGLEWD